jgi:hypothetical protein
MRSPPTRTAIPCSLADMRTLVDMIYMDARKDESKRLAESVQRALLRDLRRVNPAIEDRGVKTAPFVVLVGTRMPAILAEVSRLSNDDEAELLKRIGLPAIDRRRPRSTGSRASPRGHSGGEARRMAAEKSDGLIVGIDLGTSRSAISTSTGERMVADSLSAGQP